MLPRLPETSWDYRAAAHLLNRAGFGGTPAEVEALRSLGHAKAVARMLAVVDESVEFPKPEWAVPTDRLAMRREMRGAATEEDRQMMRQTMRREEGAELQELRGGWLRRMRTTANPLTEKMTLFWHGHFATSMEKVKDSYLLWLQNEMFRTHATGNFGALTKAVTRDPAMMIYLDTRQSRAGKPNENFARELMELFTLGEGHYTEDDIKNSARAFTGYRMDPRTQSFHFGEKSHDSGSKVFMGAKGNWDGDAIVDLILKQHQCARYMVAKIWSFFAYEEPESALVENLASDFYRGGYEVGPLLESIFSSEAFYGVKSVRTQIKGPVQWMVQTARVLELDLGFGMPEQNALRQMGQMLFAPPNVKGWDGGKAWISTSTLLYRYNLANAIVTGDTSGVMGGGRGDKQRPRMRARRGAFGSLKIDRLAPPELRGDSGALVDSLSQRLFDGQLGARQRESFIAYWESVKSRPDDDQVAELLHLMMSTPEYQLC